MKGDAEVEQCIFIQRILEHCDKMDISESMKVMTKIWGTKKTSSSIAKNLNL